MQLLAQFFDSTFSRRRMLLRTPERTARQSGATVGLEIRRGKHLGDE